MSDKNDPTKPTTAKDKFAPQNVADQGPDKGRLEADMIDVPKGSEGDRRRASHGQR